MLRTVVQSARLVVVHNDWLASQIGEAWPDAGVAVLNMGVPSAVAREDAREIVRRRHRIAADTILFTAFGKVTPEKRITQALRGLAAILPVLPNAHLMLVGEGADHYDPKAEAAALGVEDHVTVAGFVPDEVIAEYLAAADVCLCMRWPSSRETSASWLRSLAAGRPTVTTDLVHMVDVPALDPRSWSMLHTSPPSSNGHSEHPIEPACVSIDILDEDHSLKLAMRRLAIDAELRAALGRAAHALWSERFTLDRMVSGYRRAMEVASSGKAPALRTTLPDHFLTDGTEQAVRLLGEMALPESQIVELWSR